MVQGEAQGRENGAMDDEIQEKIAFLVYIFKVVGD